MHGEVDDIVPEASVSKLVDKLSSQRGIAIDYRVVPSATHFFNDHLEILGEHVEDYLSKASAAATAKAG